MSIESVTAAYLQGLDRLGKVHQVALAYRQGGFAAVEAFWGSYGAAYEAQLAAQAAPFAASAGAGAVAAGTLPVITAVGVWIALGSGYAQARNAVRVENSMSGFSQGFVCGLSRWTIRQTLDKFRRPVLKINSFDQAADDIRVDAYHDGLYSGFAAGTVMPIEGKQSYLKKMRELAGIAQPSADAWRNNRLIQIDYIIKLAAAGRRNGLIKPE